MQIAGSPGAARCKVNEGDDVYVAVKRVKVGVDVKVDVKVQDQVNSMSRMQTMRWPSRLRELSALARERTFEPERACAPMGATRGSPPTAESRPCVRREVAHDDPAARRGAS